jgi:Heparinase II/III-like protein
MKSPSLFSGIFSLIVVALMLSHAGAQEVRTWTDKASGKTIDAAYVSADATSRTVTIKNAAGQEFTLPVARLNDADIEYIRQKLTAPPPAPGTPPAPATTPPAPGAPPAVAKKGKAAAVPAGPPAPPPPVFKVIPVKGFKGPAGTDFIRSVAKVRPRLLHTAETWAALKARAATDPVLAKMIETLKKGGEDLLSKPELNKIFGADKVRGSAEGAQAMSRIATFGVLNFIDGDPKWKERAVRELIALTDKGSFSDWAPDEMELCGDFTTAVALGYDWFKDGMNAAQQATAKEFLVQKGMEALAAKLEGKPVPVTARTKQPGTVDTKPDPKKPAAKNVEKDKDDKLPPTKEEIVAASALILAAICLADEEPGAAKDAAAASDKILTRGVAAFAPGGVWPVGMAEGDEVLDAIAMVLQTLRVSGGGDFGLPYVEGMPQTGLARLHLTGPKGIFNYGDARAGNFTHSWVSTFLAGLYGNPGMKAAVGNGAPGANSAFFGTAGHVIYYNPWAGGDGTATSLDAVFPGAEVAALRSAWNDPEAAYIAMKGGTNELPTAQLDLGSFVLDLGGIRWAAELGAEDDKAAGFTPAADRTKRYNLYLEGTHGQNTLVMGGGKDEPAEKPDPKKADPKKPAGKAAPPEPTPGNQPYDARAAFIGFNSSPERGMAILDMTDAYPKAKSAHRGMMVMRGAQPYVLLQDDLVIKGTTDIDWQMHSNTEVTVAGNKATLTSGKSTLTATLLSPADAQFVVEDPPANPPGDVRNRDLQKEKVKVLKVKLKGVKGERRIAVGFSTGVESPNPPVVPLALWVPKK